jgi:hypothetical protein
MLMNKTNHSDMGTDMIEQKNKRDENGIWLKEDGIKE